MNEVKNAVTATIENNTTVCHAMQTTYVKPTIEVIEMEMEGAILQGSDFGNGGHFGRD